MAYACLCFLAIGALIAYFLDPPAPPPPAPSWVSRGDPVQGTLFDMDAVDTIGRQSPSEAPAGDRPLYCEYARTPCGRTTHVRAWGDLH